MIEIGKYRKKFPELSNLSDEELEKILESIYDLGQLAFDCWQCSKYPDRSNGLNNLDK